VVLGYVLFNGPLRIAGYIHWNIRMTNERFLKGFERKRSFFNLRHYLCICLVAVKKAITKSVRIGRYLSRRLNFRLQIHNFTDLVKFLDIWYPVNKLVCKLKIHNTN
jgi:hypothetical protein